MAWYADKYLVDAHLNVADPIYVSTAHFPLASQFSHKLIPHYIPF